MVLVLDEDPVVLSTTSRVASDLGASVRVTRTVAGAMEIARGDAPAVLITALEVAGSPRGLSLGRALRRRCGTAVVLVGSKLSAQYVGAVAAFNPEGFLCKPLRPEQVDATLRLAFRRQTPPEGGVAATRARETDLARALRQIASVVSGTGLVSLDSTTAPTSVRSLASLRPREQDVVRLLFEHYRVPAIADRLGISPQTVRNHLKHAFQVLGVHSQQELIAQLRATPVLVSRPAESAT